MKKFPWARPRWAVRKPEAPQVSPAEQEQVREYVEKAVFPPERKVEEAVIPRAADSSDPRRVSLGGGEVIFVEVGGPQGSVTCYLHGEHWRFFGRGAIHDLFVYAYEMEQFIREQVLTGDVWDEFHEKLKVAARELLDKHG